MSSSNNTRDSSERLLEKLSGMGFTVKRDEVMTSLGACRQLVDDRGLKWVCRSAGVILSLIAHWPLLIACRSR